MKMLKQKYHNKQLNVPVQRIQQRFSGQHYVQGTFSKIKISLYPLFLALFAYSSANIVPIIQ